MLGSFLVDPIRAAMFAVAHLLGGSIGAGVITVSFLLRVALLPLTLRLARRANAQQRILQSIKPQLALLGKRHAKDPEALWRETRALHRRVGFKSFDSPALLGNLARLPVLGGIYGALRQLGSARSFVWIPDLARPNVPLALLVASMSGAAAYLGSQAATESGRPAAVAALLAGAIGLAFFWHLSSALVLSWGASSVVDLAQSALLVRERRRLLTQPS
jgi:YidC/Oxa1 family membrane protein insertase